MAPPAAPSRRTAPAGRRPVESPVERRPAASLVTTEIPPDEDLETWLEVGAWSWNWMEPWTGTISFQLLALQFMRLQMLNVGYRPYTGWVIGARQRRLTQMYPEYAGRELEQYCLYSTGLGEVVNE